MSPRCLLPRRSWRLEHNQCRGPFNFPRRFPHLLLVLDPRPYDQCDRDFSPIISVVSILAIRRMSRMCLFGRFSRPLILLSCTALAAFPQSSDSNQQSTDKQDSVFIKRLQEISARGGGQVVNCLFTGTNHPDSSVTECGQRAFREHRPFFLGYEYRVWDEPVQSGYGLAGDATGNVFAVSYHDRGFPPSRSIATCN